MKAKNMKNSKKKKKGFNRLFGALLKFMMPPELSVSAEGLDQQQLKAMTQKSSLRDLLLYRYFEKKEKIGGKDFNGGLYTMADGRKGFIFRISPPPYMTTETERVIQALISAVDYDDTVMHIITHASRNINSIVKDYKELHHCKVNVKKPEVLQAMVNERANALMKWRKESMSTISDFRLRTFNNIISFSFPEDLSEQVIINQCNSFIGVLTDFKPQCFSPDELLSMTKELFHPDKEDWDTHVDVHRKMNAQIATGAVIRAKADESHFRIGESCYAKTLTTDLFPEELQPMDFQSAFMDPFGRDLQTAIPGSFICSLGIVFKDTKKQKKMVLNKMRWNIGQLNALPRELHEKYPPIKNKYQEATQIVHNVENLGEIPLDAMWSLTIFEDSLESLDALSARIIKKFEDIDGVWQLKEENSSKIAYQSFLYSLPLQHLEVMMKHLKRHDILFRSNNSQIAPLLTDIRGFGRPYMLYTGRAGQIQAIDPLSQNANYNFMVLGPMGSGKSVFTNDMATQLLQCGFKLFGMDIGRSYLPNNDSIGGQYIEFTKENNLCFNFFTNIQTQKVKIYNRELGIEEENTIIHEDELSTIIPLIGLMMGTNLSSAAGKDINTVDNDLDRKILSIMIEEAVQLAFKQDQHSAGMETVYESFQSVLAGYLSKGANEIITKRIEQAIIALTDYGKQGGKYFKYFNGANNINFESDFFLLELEELQINKIELLPVIQLAMLHRIATEAFLDDQRPMFIFFDEARHAMADAVFVRALVDFATRFRKYKKFLSVITQSVDDFFVNDQAQKLFKTSSYQVFLKSNRASIMDASREGRLKLNEFEIEQMSNIRNHAPHYAEVCIRFDDKNIISCLKLTRLELYLYSTNPNDKDRRRFLRQEYGMSFLDTAYYMMIEDEGSLSHSQIVVSMKERMSNSGNEEKHKEMWAGRISRAISERTFIIYGLPLFYMEKNGTEKRVSSFEVLTRIKTEDGDIPAAHFISIAKEFGLYQKMIRAIMIQAFELFSENEYRFSLNLSMDDILNDKTLIMITEEAQNYGVADRLTLEIESRHLTDKELTKLIDVTKYIRAQNIYIAIDNVKEKNLDFSAVLAIKPDILKVDGSIIKNLDVEQNSRMFVNFVTNGMAAIGIKTSAVHVSDERTLKSCMDHNINYFQGYALMAPAPMLEILESMKNNNAITEGYIKDTVEKEEAYA
ncbi:MAG: hypothetical protein COB67_00265 [SAR324 cluster bacterium]|uniref:EAL domain-containing protein n=1 Tax=SAR324 cluster bacterium TaxID=2024889 RepID=A0A2A4TBM2_9DELT|nr:MAG: hypothetical protein COB67_00265 [SAR324 cluster bacterium]